MSQVLGQITEAIDYSGDLADREVPKKDPVQFMKDWIKDELPDRIEDFALLTMGDYSAIPTKRAIEMGKDPENGAGIFQPVVDAAKQILPGSN